MLVRFVPSKVPLLVWGWLLPVFIVFLCWCLCPNLSTWDTSFYLLKAPLSKQWHSAMLGLRLPADGWSEVGGTCNSGPHGPMTHVGSFVHTLPPHRLNRDGPRAMLIVVLVCCILQGASTIAAGTLADNTVECYALKEGGWGQRAKPLGLPKTPEVSHNQ